jgi:hypothetical protein
MINVMAADRQERRSLMKQLSSSRSSLSSNVIKSMRRRIQADDDDCTTATSSHFFEAPRDISLVKSCLKRTIRISTTKKKAVTFGSLTIHEHPVILGDNPSVSSGSPLTISWESQASLRSSVDEYEASRPARRTKDTMLVPRSMREDWLRSAGYARSDFTEMNMKILKSKKERAASAKVNLLEATIRKLASAKTALSTFLPRKLRRR